MRYIHLNNYSDPPILSNVGPFKAVVIIDEKVDADWQDKISKWLVNSGCCYMMAWGIDCSSWDDSVDWANLEQYQYGDIPDDKLVMTTWHENDTLEHVFWFCAKCAHHNNEDQTEIIIIDISKDYREEEIIKLYQIAQQVNTPEPPSRPCDPCR